MPKVQLVLLNIFHLKTGKKKLDYEGETIGDIIKQFLNEYKSKLNDEILNKKKNKLDSNILILLNGKNEKDYKKKLQEGDKLYLSYPLSGG